MISAFGVDHGPVSKADRRQAGAALAGAGAATAGVGEYASGAYGARWGGHTGLKNLGTEDIATRREYVKAKPDPNWKKHNLHLGRAEGAVMEEKRVIPHLARGAVGANAARLGGYGALAAGSLMVAHGNRRKVSKSSNDDVLSPTVLQGAGATSVAGGVGLRQLYRRKAKVEGARAAMADKLHAKTTTMPAKMTAAVKERRYGFHEGRARQARHFEDVFRQSSKTGTGIAAAGGAMIAAGAYGHHMHEIGRQQVAKSAFGIDHDRVGAR